MDICGDDARDCVLEIPAVLLFLIFYGRPSLTLGKPARANLVILDPRPRSIQIQVYREFPNSKNIWWIGRML